MGILLAGTAALGFDTGLFKSAYGRLRPTGVVPRGTILGSDTRRPGLHRTRLVGQRLACQFQGPLFYHRCRRRAFTACRGIEGSTRHTFGEGSRLQRPFGRLVAAVCRLFGYGFFGGGFIFLENTFLSVADLLPTNGFFSPAAGLPR